MIRPFTRALTCLATLACAAAPAAAQQIRDCEGFEANARNLILPVADNVRSYANGTITLIGLDTGGEPACCSSHVMVLYPGGNDEPFANCVLVSREADMGFAGLQMAETAAAYDPARGLMLSVPVSIFLPEAAIYNSALLHLTVNQALGAVTATLEPGPNA